MDFVVCICICFQLVIVLNEYCCFEVVVLDCYLVIDNVHSIIILYWV